MCLKNWQQIIQTVFQRNFPFREALKDDGSNDVYEINNRICTDLCDKQELEFDVPTVEGKKITWHLP